MDVVNITLLMNTKDDPCVMVAVVVTTPNKAVRINSPYGLKSIYKHSYFCVK